MSFFDDVCGGHLPAAGFCPHDEWMKPLAAREHVRRQSAEEPKLSDQVRLIGVAHVECDARPIDSRPSARVRQPRLKPREPPVQLRPDPDPLAKSPRQVLA